MKSIIVAKNLNIGAGLGVGATKDDVRDLSDGAITVSRSDTDILLRVGGAWGPLPPHTKLQFIQGTNDVPVLSPVINPFTLTWYATGFTAPLPKIVSIGRNTAGVGNWTLAADGNLDSFIGEYAKIRIYDLSAEPGVTNKVVIVEHLIRQGDTNATVSAALLTKLQAYEGVYYESVVRNNAGADWGFTFTGLNRKNFRVISELLLANTPVTVEQAYREGHGLASVLSELEKKYASRKGRNNTNWLQNDLYTSDFYIDPNTNYDVFVLTWTDPNKHYIGAGTDPMIQTLLVAIPLGGNQAGQLGHFLNKIPHENIAALAEDDHAAVPGLAVDPVLTNDARNYDLNAKDDVSSVLTWNDADQILDVKVNGTSIAYGDYTITDINGTTATFAVKNDPYLLEVDPDEGDVLNVVLYFDRGVPQTLVITVIDTA